ncbi:MAG: hypothetical protein KJ914_06270 [Gammaproteobacteria bacterium]|nr:hypothetical protein [Gammaproteobacteria bacterium]MBU1725112.1 hypothetical protein [Gammaproteobacteria bacterium]MBU2004994.1 hypothetical protein [Gammaproteobacteria bacterium]
MSIREGLWDCPACGAKGVLGRYHDCPSCNLPRADGVRFYLPKDASEITSFVQISDATAGADWYCQHCDSGNTATASACQHCGANRENNPVHQTRTYAPEAIPHSAKEAEITPETPLPQPRKKLGKGKIIAGGLTLSTGFGIYLAVTPSHIPVTVSEFAWERSVVVEEYKTLRKTGWDVPQGGRALGQKRAFHHYDSVLDHYEQRTQQVCDNVQTGSSTYNCGSRDLGNGYFQDQTCTRPEYQQVCHNETYQQPVYRQEPRYATEYTFEIEQWVAISQPTIARQDHTPLWPKIKLGDKQRTARPKERYSVTLTDKDDKAYAYAPDFKLWQNLKIGQRFTATVSHDDEVLALEPAEQP